jgi:hypothetical protein
MSLLLNGTDGVTYNDGTLQSSAPVGRNRIINGNMTIDQRNAGASVTPASGTYTLDRWVFYVSQSSKLTAQQNAGSVTPPVGFSNYLGVTSSSAYSVLAGDYFGLVQNIEGFNTADLGWGTANAKTVTLSFQVYSSLTGTFGGVVKNSASNRTYPFTYSISSANTWTTATVTIAGDTTGTWVGATNGIGIQLIFGLGVGSTYSGTAGSWAAANYLSATGATSVVGTSGATLYITGVQLETGTTATDFENLQYTTQLQLCQRYYAKLNDSTGATNLIGIVQIESSTSTNGTAPFSMRATPTSTFSGLTISDGGVTPTVTSVTALANLIGGVAFTLNCSAGTLTTGRAGRIRIGGSGTAYLDFSAEL